MKFQNSVMLYLDVQETYFHSIELGLKKVEGRLGKEKYLALKPKDKIFLTMSRHKEGIINQTYQRSPEQGLICEVVKISRYSSFKEMLEHETLARVLPNETSIERGVAIYRQFYSEYEENIYGVAAITLEPVTKINQKTQG